MSFPPSAACKFLDLHPVNLRNLHLHLTKNPFASRPPHLCGVTLRECDQRNRAKGSRGNCPLQGQGTASLVGFGATPQLLVGRSTQRKKSTKGAGSKASLPVTLRVRRRAPKQVLPTTTLCRARWARPHCLPAASAHNPPKNLHKSPKYDRIPPDKGD